MGKDGTIRPVWSSKKQDSTRTWRISQKRTLGYCWRQWKLSRQVISRRGRTLVPSWVHHRSSLLGRNPLAREFRPGRTLGSISNCRPWFRSWYVTISDLAIFNSFFLLYDVAFEVSPTWLTPVYLRFVQVAVTWLHLSLIDWTTSPLINDSLLVRRCDSVLGVVRVLFYRST